MTRRRMVMMLVVVVMVMGAMAPASASDPACVDGGSFGAQDWDNHGSHITGDYVGGPDGNAGGGKPAHFGGSGDDPTPGATFCNQHGQGGANAAHPSGP